MPVLVNTCPPETWKAMAGRQSHTASLHVAFRDRQARKLQEMLKTAQQENDTIRQNSTKSAALGGGSGRSMSPLAQPGRMVSSEAALASRTWRQTRRPGPLSTAHPLDPCILRLYMFAQRPRR